MVEHQEQEAANKDLLNLGGMGVAWKDILGD